MNDLMLLLAIEDAGLQAAPAAVLLLPAATHRPRVRGFGVMKSQPESAKRA